ncbi:MAG: XRE family transcriptional regulator, partial [Defluviitaleaceae bacterium]|nr:XRE family transcriptional regulator [Defluviitaleaceae bacterium]
MKNEFNHIRLREAREYKSISQTEMSKRIDVSLNSYKKLEAGEMILDNRMAHKVSSALDFEFDYRYFFTKSDIEIAIGDINFRSNVGYSKKREGIQRKNAKHLLEMYRFLTPYTKAMPQLNLPSIPNEYIDKLLTKNEQEYIEVIESISKYVRSFFGIGSFPLNKFSSLLETHGVILAQMDFKDKDKGDAYSLSAFDNRRNKMSMIVIAKNNKQTLARVNFNLAHELGHLVLHPFKNDMMEKQADNFAASFLMPRDAFLSDLQGLGNISMPNKEGRE